MTLSIVNTIKYRQYFDKLLIKKYIVPGILGVIIGALLLVIAPIPIVELSLGIFIIAFIITKFKGIRKENDEVLVEEAQFTESHLKNVPNSILYPGAFSYGFIGGLIGTPGPINVVILEKRGHERESFIGNFSFISIMIFLLLIF